MAIDAIRARYAPGRIVKVDAPSVGQATQDIVALLDHIDALSARCAELEAELAQYRPGAVCSDLGEISSTGGLCFTDAQAKPIKAPTHCGCYTWTNGFGDSGSYLCPEHRPGGAAMKGE